MPNSRDNPYGTFFWIAVTIAGTGMLGTAGAFINLNSNVQVLTAELKTVKDDVKEVRDGLKQSEAGRYTTAEASADLGALQNQITGVMDRNLRQDDAISGILLKLATMEANATHKR